MTAAQRIQRLKRAKVALRPLVEEHPVTCNCIICDAYYLLAPLYYDVTRPGHRIHDVKENGQP